MRYSVKVSPTPPATEEITILISSGFFILFYFVFHIVKGIISCLIDK